MVVVITVVAMSTIATRVSQLLNLSQLSAREFDRISGLVETHCSMILHRKSSSIDTSTASKIADAFGVTLDWLANGTGDAPTAEHVRAAVAAARERHAAAKAVGE